MPSPGNATSSTGSRKRSRTGSCKEPVPKKLLKDPEPGVAPLGLLIVPSLAQRAPSSLFLARPKGHPLSSPLRGQFGRPLRPPIHFPTAGLRSIYVLLALRQSPYASSGQIFDLPSPRCSHSVPLILRLLLRFNSEHVVLDKRSISVNKRLKIWVLSSVYKCIYHQRTPRPDTRCYALTAAPHTHSHPYPSNDFFNLNSLV